MHVCNPKDLAAVSGGVGAPFPIGAEGMATAVAVGAGVGAARAISTAGSLGALGAGATAVGGAALGGLIASGKVGWEFGSMLNESEAVRGTAAGMVERFASDGPVGAVTNGLSEIFGMLFGGGGGGGRRLDGDEAPVAAY